MATRLQVQDGTKRQQVVIPVRFSRAVTGAPVLDAPELDDRGYRMPRTGLNATTARGPMFGITVGDTVRVQVVREDIDPAAALFATLGPVSGQLQITDPPAGTAIAAGGIVTLRAVSDSSTGQKLEIRFGSATGPIVGEAEPHTFTPRTFRVTPHLVTISGPAAGTAPAPDLTAIFDMVQRTWRPVGVNIVVGATVNDTFTGFPITDAATLGNSTTAAGTLSQVVGSASFVPRTCNIYFLRFTLPFLGLGINRQNRAGVNFANPAIIIGVDGNVDATGTQTFRRSGNILEIGNDVAHEIGHFLTLAHADRRNSGDPAPDRYCQKMLMHPVNPQPRPPNLAQSPPVPLPLDANDIDPRADDNGYGQIPATFLLPGGATLVQTRLVRGFLLTLKNFSTHASDGETITARQRLNSPDAVLY